MKKQPIKHLTPLQRVRLIRITALLAALALAWLVFAPRSGLWSLLRQHSRLVELERKAIQLEQDNKELEKEISRLKNDPSYLEEVARREHGLLKKNEYIYDFSQPKGK